MEKIEIDETKLKETATRFYNIMDPWARPDTLAEVVDEIRRDPLATINYFLDYIENN